jgi:hypothetical protein
MTLNGLDTPEALFMDGASPDRRRHGAGETHDPFNARGQPGQALHYRYQDTRFLTIVRHLEETAIVKDLN